MASHDQLSRRLAIVPAAQRCQQIYGVPASVTIAQWELESSWGTSELTVKANNCFGIKAHHLDQPDTYEEFLTAEYVHGHKVMELDKFEKYPTIEDSFLDHARLLSKASRYSPAMSVKSDPIQFAQKLQECGYSTSPTYGTSLGSIIKGSILQRYDSLEV